MIIEKEINPHFEDFIFNWDNFIQLLVGGYGSSKSYHVAVKLILKLVQEKRKALVVREVFDTLRDSCYDLLLEVIDSLGLDDFFKTTTSPMRIEGKNGSKIIFKGMDKPTKLKSLNGVTIVWVEEAPEVKYAGYKELIGRLRHPTLPLFIMLSSNPAPKSNWLFQHFFKLRGFNDETLYRERVVVKDKVLYHHSTADDNLFLPRSYIEQLDDMKTYDPDLYRVARLGRFGVTGLLVLPQFEVMPHQEVINAIRYIPSHLKRAGMDFGFVTSYNALIRMAIDHDQRILYIYSEYYKNKTTDDKTAEDIKEFAETGELIRADCAEPKTIKYYKQQGFNIKPAKKFPGSRLQYTKKVKRFKQIICSDECKHTIDELQELTYLTDKDGNLIEDEFSTDPHTFSAIWYGLDGYEVSDLKGAYGVVTT
jgi:phage terminase large subunit